MPALTDVENVIIGGGGRGIRRRRSKTGGLNG
jgi:hypothetical protein